MIVRNAPGFLSLFLVYQGSIAPRVLPRIVAMALLAVITDRVCAHWPNLFAGMTTAPFAFLGVALSLYLGFRNNACYERWWEARKLWGQVMIDVRSLVRLSTAYLSGQSKEAEASRRQMILLLGGFVMAMRDYLRHRCPLDSLKPWLTEYQLEKVAESVNPVDMVLTLIGNELAAATRDGSLDTITARNFERHLSSLSAVLAGCERIDNTPLPFAYTVLVHRVCYIYCVLLPFGLVAETASMTPLITAIVAYAFFGLDELSQELGQPFGNTPNSLPLNAMSRTMERLCLQSLGVDKLPPALKPNNFRLD